MELMYDAFISYRHMPGDMMVAEKLQTMLEKLKIKGGKKITVFRDKSDLPTSGDLGSDIQEALEHSRFLIVVCSPSYQNSKWCMAELQHFRQLHGNTNANILPILVEGEPTDSFPQLLRQENRVVTDDAGNQRVVQVEVEPLGADVRAESARAMAKKLKTEYLRLAAPILGVSFDALYQRAQRRKRAITAASIAALAAFAVYSSVMFAQIYIRQRQLEEKQAELYQNESIRLANEAVNLAAEDTPLAMLLVNAALPENLAKPDYPLTQDAKLAAQSVALQSLFEAASEPLTLKSRITFDNMEWSLDRFHEDGQYMVLYDFLQTYLYDAYSGQLITTLRDESYCFFDGINRCFQASLGFNENGEKYMTYIIYDTFSEDELGRAEVDEDATHFSFDPESRKLYIASWDADTDTYYAVGWFDTTGTYTEVAPFPLDSDMPATYSIPLRHLSGRTSDLSLMLMGEHLAYSKQMPDIYNPILDSFMQAFGSQYEPYSVSSTKDGKLCLIQAYNYGYETDDALATVWSLEDNRLLASLEGECIIEPHTDLIYRIHGHELEIWETHPSNYTFTKDVPLFDFVSKDGRYGFVREYDEWSGDSVVRLWVYDLFDSGSSDKHAQEAGSFLSIDPLNSLYFITPDGRRVAYVTPEGFVEVIDIPSCEVIFSTNEVIPYINDITISPDGTRVVSTSYNELRFTFHAFDPDSGLEISSATLSVDGWPIPYLTFLPSSECTGELFLLNMLGQSVIFDVNHLASEPWIIPTSNPILFPDWDWDSPSALTDDNLLVLPCKGYTETYYSEQITHIFDLESRQEISFHSDDTIAFGRIYYDDICDSLITRNGNRFHVQRRGIDGNFKIAYTIVPQHADMELNVAGHASDGTWLVLQNDEYCEIYRLEDGTLCYMLRKPDDRNSQMAVIDGQLYDFCIGWHCSIPLPTTKEAQSYIRGILAAGSNARVLTEQELKTYYIPEEWRNKNS